MTPRTLNIRTYNISMPFVLRLASICVDDAPDWQTCKMDGCAHRATTLFAYGIRPDENGVATQAQVTMSCVIHAPAMEALLPALMEHGGIEEPPSEPMLNLKSVAEA